MKKLLVLIALLPAAALATPEEKIVSLGGDVTEIVYALGAQSSLVARDSTSQWPEEVTALPDVGYLRQLNAEGILATRPTLVLASAQAQPSLVLKQVGQSKVRVVTVPASNELSVIDEKVQVIAQATHRESQGEALRQTLRQELAMLPSSTLNKRVLFILNHGGMTAMAAGQQTGADAADDTPCVTPRRGRVDGMEAHGNSQIVRAYVPLAEMFGYATVLRSASQGRGTFMMVFDHYEDVPKSVQEEIIKKNKGEG